jgi:hypothetical protein
MRRATLPWRYRIHRAQRPEWLLRTGTAAKVDAAASTDSECHLRGSLVAQHPTDEQGPCTLLHLREPTTATWLEGGGRRRRRFRAQVA